MNMVIIGKQFQEQSKLTRGIIASIFTSMYIRLGSSVLASEETPATAVRSKLSCRFNANEFSHKRLSRWKLTCTGFTCMNAFDGGTEGITNGK